MEKILLHSQAQQRFAELGIIVSAASVRPVRFHLHGCNGKVLSQFAAWEGIKENGVKRYISLTGGEIDRYSREYKDFQVSAFSKGNGFRLLEGEYLTLVIDNEFVRAFDFSKPTGQLWNEVERRRDK